MEIERSIFKEEVIHDESFIASLDNAKSEQEIIGLLAGKGIKVNEKEFRDIVLNELSQKDELTEDDLELVSGGWLHMIVILGAALILIAILKGCGASGT